MALSTVAHALLSSLQFLISGPTLLNREKALTQFTLTSPKHSTRSTPETISQAQRFVGYVAKYYSGFAAFLDGRCQRVIVNGSKSSWSPVTRSIPQRSVFGPIFFVCYTNDMPEVVDSPIHMFADDTKIYRQITTQSDQETLHTDLKQLEEW